ncbi:Protein held out wings [Eumeta japonica]|uniref:Protein held out wings n=1 Tax=Eumeta variegata TaxID=151549 RepID=A0A4C1WDI2_EUMVA|nr:Protein held out wings [Eumeta japonica]
MGLQNDHIRRARIRAMLVCSGRKPSKSFKIEIAKVRASLFQINGVKKEPLVLPEPEGMVTTLTEKVYVPVKEHPDGTRMRVCSLTVSYVYLEWAISTVTATDKRVDLSVAAVRARKQPIPIRRESDQLQRIRLK